MTDTAKQGWIREMQKENAALREEVERLREQLGIACCTFAAMMMHDEHGEFGEGAKEAMTKMTRVREGQKGSE